MAASSNGQKSKKTNGEFNSANSRIGMGATQLNRDDDEISIGNVGDTVNGSAQGDEHPRVKTDKEGDDNNEVLLFGVDDKENLDTVLSSLTGISSK